MSSVISRLLLLNVLRTFAAVTLIAIASLFVSPVTVFAAAPVIRHEGLLITPLRQYVTIDAGTPKTSNFTIANHTTKSLDINLSIKSFSVADYTYNYQFNDATNGWVKLAQSTLHMAANTSEQINYTISAPQDSAPGSHYYSLIASATDVTTHNTYQVIDQLYLTVNGTLIHASYLKSAHIERLSFGHSFSYQLNPINSGNVYSFAFVTAQLRGPTAQPASTAQAHILIPNKVRSIDGSISAPILPGVYQATFGYKTDSGQIVSQSRYVVYVPPWSIAILLAIVLIICGLISGHKRKKTTNLSGHD